MLVTQILLILPLGDEQKMKRSPLIFIFLLSSCTSNLSNAPKSRPPLSDFFEVSDTCPHTCFMGINPGVTIKDEVIPLITASLYVPGAMYSRANWPGRDHISRHR